MPILIGLLLAGLSLLTIVIKRAYESFPVKELKKRARDGDKISLLLHRSAAYGTSLSAVLWLLIGLSTSVFFVYVSRNFSAWVAGLLCALLIWLGFVWLPKRRASKIGLWIAARLSPVVSRVASFLHPVVRGVINFIHRYLPVHIHTGLYDEQDLVKLLKQQRQQPDNQISDSSIEIAIHAISFGDKLVSDVLVPRRAVKMVKADDTTGPLLMSELHDSGFSRFPVYKNKKDEIIGILYLRDLVETKNAAKVENKMRPEVLYIHEEQTLDAALQAILKTRQHMFVVVNSFEEYVGILTIEDVLEQIVGQQIVDEFDQYDDMRAVAASGAQEDHQSHAHSVEE